MQTTLWHTTFLHRKRYLVLIGLLFLAAITYLDRVCITVASVRMQKELGLNPADWGWVLGAFTVSYAIFEIPTGAMGDRLGGRRVLTRIVLWWSLFTVLTGAVRATPLLSAFGLLLVIRFLFGVGEAGAFPNISAVVSRWFPKRERARSMGMAWTASRVGGALTPLLIVPLQQTLGWRAAFFVLGLFGITWAIVWRLFYRDHPSEMPGISPEELAVIGETPTVSRSHRLPWRQVFHQPNFWLILLMYHAYCWGSYFYISWMPTYLQRGRGFSESQMGWWASLPFVLSGTANTLGGLASDRLVPIIGLDRARRLIGAGGLLLGGVLLAGAAAVSNNSIAAVLLALAYGAMDCMLPVAWAVCLDVGGEYSGAVSAWMNTAGQAASFMSSVALGYAVKALQDHGFSMHDSYNIPVFPLAGMLVVSGLLFLRIRATLPLVLGPAQLPPDTLLPPSNTPVPRPKFVDTGTP